VSLVDNPNHGRMEDHRSSITARIVSLARALAVSDEGGERLPVDPTAPALLGGRLPRSLARWSLSHPWRSQSLRVASLGFVDTMKNRTTAIDDFVRRGVAAGVAQVVILGAGLDGRAWRMPELADARVFEVDHPATQATKRHRLSASQMQPTAGEVVFVTVDFERDTLTDRLRASGHDLGSPTLWVWEGVTMYLLPETTAATLHELASLSASGSRLAATYARSDNLLLQLPLGTVALRLFESFGEPLLGLTTPEAFLGRVTAAGWQVDDANPLSGYPDFERLVVARRP